MSCIFRTVSYVSCSAFHQRSDVVNQWGRDGNFTAGGARGSGAGGMLIAAVVAVIIGAGGGYAAARFLPAAPDGALAARDQRIAELTKTLSDLKFDSQDASSQQSDLARRVKDLQ
eukprot:gene1690-2281_t